MLFRSSVHNDAIALFELGNSFSSLFHYSSYTVAQNERVWQFNVRKSLDTCVERLDSECFVLMQNYSALALLAERCGIVGQIGERLSNLNNNFVFGRNWIGRFLDCELAFRLPNPSGFVYLSHFGVS